MTTLLNACLIGNQWSLAEYLDWHQYSSLANCTNSYSGAFIAVGAVGIVIQSFKFKLEPVSTSRIIELEFGKMLAFSNLALLIPFIG